MRFLADESCDFSIVRALRMGGHDVTERADIRAKVKEAEEDAQDEVWAGYRYVVIADNQEPDGLKVIDLGAGHASSAETLCGRIIAALKSQGLLNESVGAGYIERNWPPALKEAEAWPLASLRQSFLNGALTRLLDPDAVLRGKIVEFVLAGDFGLASGQRPDGTYERVWFSEPIGPDEVSFEAGVFLLAKGRAKVLKGGVKVKEKHEGEIVDEMEKESTEEEPKHTTAVGGKTITLRLAGSVPPEIWNRLGTRIIPKLKSGEDLKIAVDFSVTLNTESVQHMESELRQTLEDLGLGGKIRIERSEWFPS